MAFVTRCLALGPVDQMIQSIHPPIKKRISLGGDIVYTCCSVSADLGEGPKGRKGRAEPPYENCGRFRHRCKHAFWLKRFISYPLNCVTLTFKCLSGNAPAFFSEFLRKNNIKGTRSEAKASLLYQAKKVIFRGRPFKNSVPILCKRLPAAQLRLESDFQA